MRRLCYLLWIQLAAALLTPKIGAVSLPTLTTIGQVRSLDRDSANHYYPVRLRAQVTFYHVAEKPVRPDEQGHLGTNLFVRDSTGGTWIGITGKESPLRPGDLIDLEGITTQTGFAPDIVNAQWHTVGSAPLPEPKRLEFGRLASTQEDAHWVEVEGVVRSAELVSGDLRLSIAMDGGNLFAYIPEFRGPVPDRLVDSRVLIQGVCGAFFNQKNQVRGLTLFVPRLNNIRTLEPGSATPFSSRLQSIGNLLRYTLKDAAGHRVRIRGTVTLQHPGRDLFIEESGESILVHTAQTTPATPGERVDVVGFPAIGEFAPTLEDAEFRIVGRSAPPVPLKTTVREIFSRKDDAALVQIEGRLLDSVTLPGERYLFLESGNIIVPAQLSVSNNSDELSELERDSRLRVTGVGTVTADKKDDPIALRLLLRSPSDVMVLKRPPWWTIRHAVWVVGTLAALAFGVAVWGTVLRRKVQRQTNIIREQLESEAVLERRYSRLFERNLAGVYRMTVDGEIVDCNPSLARILGYHSRRELLDLEKEQRSCLGERKSFLAKIRECKKITNSEAHLRRRDGQQVWGIENANLLEENGEAPIIEGTLIEITELKQTMTALEERTEHLNALLMNNPLGIVVVDDKGIIQTCNPAFEQLFLYSAREAVGARVHDLIVPPELKPTAREKLDSVLAGQSFSMVENRRRKDWSLVEVEIHAVPLAVAGRVIGAYGIYQDITDRAHAASVLHEAKEAAEAASRAKSEFLANMSHEIRTPMNGVLLAAKLALDENPTPSQKECLEMLRLSGESLLALLNDILDVSKIEAGKMELLSGEFSLRECIENCLHVIRPRAQQKRLALKCDLSGVPERISGDALRLRQIILNLLGNAVKFTEEGSIEINVRQDIQPDGSILFHFAVRDTGIGIPQDKLPLIFNEFEQADATSTRRYGGSGLGLAISRKLAGLMGGSMWVQSQPGEGSTFHFTASLQSASERSEPGQRSTSHLPAPHANQALRILLAEDNAVNRRLTTRLLEKQGHSVVSVETGTDAVRLSLERPFDVVLMDIHMPELDGVQATRRIRLRESAIGDHLPIIAITASAMKEDRQRCLNSGMDAYISKPVSVDELIVTLRAVMEKARKEQEQLMPVGRD